MDSQKPQQKLIIYTSLGGMENLRWWLRYPSVAFHHS